MGSFSVQGRFVVQQNVLRFGPRGENRFWNAEPIKFELQQSCAATATV
jgi:hypothetical protein